MNFYRKLRHIGRLFFISMLFYSTLEKLSNTTEFVEPYFTTFNKIQIIARRFGVYDFLPRQTNFANQLPMIIKISGIFQFTLAGYILAGQKKGGYLAALYIFLGWFINNISFPKNFAFNNLKFFSNQQDRSYFVNSFALIGMAIALGKGENQLLYNDIIQDKKK